MNEQMQRRTLPDLRTGKQEGKRGAIYLENDRREVNENDLKKKKHHHSIRLDVLCYETDFADPTMTFVDEELVLFQRNRKKRRDEKNFSSYVVKNIDDTREV